MLTCKQQGFQPCDEGSTPSEVTFFNQSIDILQKGSILKVEVTSVTIKRGESWETNDPEELLVEIARVSSSREDKWEAPDKLIGYLIRNKHWSPFQMISVTMGITTSRAISHQIIRHTSFGYQEFSQRYANVAKLEPVELRWQKGKDNRQSSLLPIGADHPLQKKVDAHNLASAELYTALIQGGIARETARFVLPEAAQTTLYMAGTLRSWIHYLQVRDDGHAQLEHQNIAIDIKAQLRFFFPHTWTALGW